MTRRRCIAALLLAGLWASPAPAQPALPETVEAFDAVFRAWTEKHRTGGAVLAVSYRNRLVLARGYNGASPDSRMHIGSLSKAITASCVATLIQNGRLALDSNLGTVLGGYFQTYGAPRDARIRTITIEQLLTHHAGFGTPTNRDPFTKALDDLQTGKSDSAITMVETLQGIMRIELGSAPGESYRYANAGYHTLGTIIELVSGQTYARTCADAVLAPVGIRDAKLSPTQFLRGASGGWLLSGPEYLAFFKIFEPDNDTVLSAATRTWLMSAEGKWTDASQSVFYSLGVFIRPGKTQFVRAHTGGYELSDRTLGPARHYSYASVVTRSEANVTWFAAHVPILSAAARQELGSELRRAAVAVKTWPKDDRFPEFGLK